MDFLLTERARTGKKDRGEVEAVVQASKVGATVIVDDPWGRKLAARYDLDYHGTIWMFRRFYELELMESSACRSNFESLLNHGIRLPRKEVNALLRDIGEEPLQQSHPRG